MSATTAIAPRDTISTAIREAMRRDGRPAVVAFATAGFPDRAGFVSNLKAIASEADVVEIGVPFSDPMADGATIQRASFAALRDGFTLPWLLGELEAMQPRTKAPLLLMSYLNPLLAFGLNRLPEAAASAGVSGFIIPDLPYEESAEIRAALDRVGVALVQMVTPVTPAPRLRMLCEASQGFVYAVTMTGTTGKSVAVPDEVLEYMDRVRAVSPVPVCAGFGIRSRDQVVRMQGHVDGVVVGSALVEVLERGEDPAAFVRTLKGP
ncbi:MAG TPA: tryptophan synthase subunit alpha [Steroidobacteraceae bacterium]|nr:tryptophan synthase subunit alpha [Steroidobacteraceae bacterium]